MDLIIGKFGVIVYFLVMDSHQQSNVTNAIRYIEGH